MSWFDRHAYITSILAVAVVTAVGLATTSRLRLRPSNIDIAYLLVVLVSALKWGRLPAMFTAAMSAIVFDFCFIPAQFTFGFTDLPYALNLVGYLVVAIAVSSLAARSQELQIERTARARAEAQSEAKDAIVRHVSHELRNPLNAILGWAQVLERTSLDTSILPRASSGIANSARSLARLIDDLFTASKITTGKWSVDLQPAKLAPIVSRAVDAAALIAQDKQISIRSMLQPVGEVFADESRMEQIVSNLLSNAIKFTPRGGHVSVRLARVADDAELTVSDTGIGISREFLPRVFEQFSQADASGGQGLGLGLSIVKYLVGAHHGDISVRSEGAGAGTTFSVRLPIASAQRLNDRVD